jgi:DNA repair protein RecN (Recombination protein N)
MLTHIHVRDFAIVERLDLSLEQGMTVLTGETGAGKSILIGALGLALGDKADVQKIRPGRDAAEVTLSLDVSRLSPVQGWLKEQALEADGECVVRRVITRDGRSRAFVNHSPVPLQVLRQLGETLIDIHGQHAHQSLLRADVQRALLDDYAGHGAQVAEVADVFRQWKQVSEQLEDLTRRGHEQEAQQDLLRYQLRELEALGLGEDEIEGLNEEHTRLANVHRLLEGAQRVLALLYEQEDGALVSQLSSAVNEIEHLKHFDGRLEAPASLLRDALIPLQEASTELRHYLNQLDADPERLAWVEQRLSQIHALARKHRVAPEDLPALQARLKGELGAWQSAEAQIAALEASKGELATRYRKLAGELRESRARAAHRLEQSVSSDLERLGMAGGCFSVRFEHLDHFSANGMERMEFFVSTNPGQPLMPLTRVVSGGELSRISLAVQVASVQSGQVPILVFDEVDVGIGGRVAEIVGQKLLTLAQTRQVICITHLPQVAALGQQHLQVSKHARAGSTHAEIRYLSTEDRIAELARMSGGVEITTQTMAHAKALLERAQQQNGQRQGAHS